MESGIIRSLLAGALNAALGPGEAWEAEEQGAGERWKIKAFDEVRGLETSRLVSSLEFDSYIPAEIAKVEAEHLFRTLREGLPN